MEKTQERIDEIGFGSLKLIQKPSDFCYGVDAVILSEYAAVHAKSTGRIMDLGTGTGIIPLILSHKTDAETICGVEVQEDSYERALRNVQMNHLEQRLQMFHCNVKEIPGELKGSFDVVTMNPPYMEGGRAIPNELSAKLIARHEVLGSLEDFMRAAAMLLTQRGELFIVHRPSRLVDIFTLARKYHLEPKTMRMVAPKAGEKANIVLVGCRKNAGRELKVEKELYVYGDDGEYTEELKQMYKD